MVRDLDDKEREMIINFGALNYQPSMIAEILGIDETQVNIDGNDELAKLYRRGRSIAKYKLQMKVFELAQQGDLKAIQKYEQMILQNQRMK